MIKTKRKQRGVALLFALGMLTILLVTAMAFVANALTAQKVAANNSARSQARMFAQSALSRAMASVMVYQYQYYKKNTSFPESFAHIYSYAGTGGLNDGLLTENSVKSLMNLPMDDTIVAKNLAREFNNLFVEDRWQGQWVNFYDNTTNTADRQIIGRAAWQVLSTSPQILAPVFLGGHLETDGTPGWFPSDNRWGREIDEIGLPDSGSLFSPAVTGGNKLDKDSYVRDYEKIYTTLGFTTDDAPEKRFVDKWLSPDTVEESTVLNPTPIVPESYYYQESDKGKKIQVMRFNISEISSESADLAKYASGATASSDPWYLRFGVNTPAGKNNITALNNLTRDSSEFQSGDEYDFDLPAADRPSLPFLRRIGNASADKPTFKKTDGSINVEAWRRQIAANFNDYCDADSIPTSNVPATNWMTLTGDTHPAYTGNEKTPYLYELGFRMGFYPNNSDLTKSGIALVASEATLSSSTCKTRIDKAYIGIAPIVKLANVYDFDPTGFSDFTAGVQLGEVTVKFKPTKVSLKVEYTADDLSIGTLTPSEVAVKGTGYDMNFNVISGKIAAFDTAQTLKIADGKLADQLSNTEAKNPYPLLVPEKTIQASEVKPLEFEAGGDTISFTLTPAILSSIGSALPSGATISRVTLVSIDSVEVTGITLNVNRAYLSAKLNGNATAIGLDYVRTLAARSWSSGEDDGNYVINFPKEGSKIPGYYFSIRNYDPRQNLNNDDWSEKVTFAKSDDIKDVSVDDALEDAMCVGDKVDSDAELRQGKANTGIGDNTEKNKFLANHESETQDVETVSGPGWSAGTTHLSTAFIRNAPMMSPWEIGLIHRGVRWQTLNIKNACDPKDNSKTVQLTAHAPNGDLWNEAEGTSYEGGDGGILDQIKMTDQCSTYGKININKLRDDHPEYDSALDPEIIRVLFNKIRRGQSIAEFFKRSTRVNGDFNEVEGEPTGTPISWASTAGIAEKLVKARHPEGSTTQAISRAQFLDYVSDSNYDLSNAFTGTDGTTDAAQEEVIGKTINLLDVAPATPSQIQMVIVAQAIRDVGGIQHRKDASGNNQNRNCAFGTFDYDATNNIYYDEIIGEVKMFVTLDRDINTGRMTIRRIDYLE